MKTYDEILKFYELETGKNYKITGTYRQGFITPINPLAIGEIFTIVFLLGEPEPQVFSKKHGRYFPISKLNFYDYEECKEEMLDAKEKEYLNFIIKPFKKRAKYIIKTADYFNKKQAYFISIYIDTDGKEDFLCFPNFYAEANMYIKLKPGIKYTLKDLGLDE